MCGDFTWRVSDCEEFSWIYLQEKKEEELRGE